MVKSICSVDGCGKSHIAKGFCWAHYARLRTYADPLAPLLRQPNVGSCSVDGCDQPMRKRTWCASHYAQWQRTGREPQPFKYKWGDGLSPCLNCGSDEGRPWLHRRFCSDGCRVAFDHYGGPRPTETTCVACGRHDRPHRAEASEGKESKPS